MSQKIHTPEPFGHFKAEAFGWTDCAETDDGAQPLYDQAAIDELGERLKDALRQRDALLAALRMIAGANDCGSSMPLIHIAKGAVEKVEGGAA